MQTFVNQYLNEVKQISSLIDTNCIEKIIKILKKIREEKGRIFFLGVGGSSGNATHAVNDFRKIVGIESYAPTDNVSELTARVNDDGWDSSFVNWLMGSNLKSTDAVFVLSVGGGNLEKNISANIVNALKYCQTVGAKILGIVGKDGGYTAKVADACLVIPTVNNQTITPHTESFQAVIWHLIVCHPELKKNEMKWESTK
ncbi:SIS domain-containing protein [Candidatus Babeliales bacterium]|nr:SIS domain-containing protein [Candidatus Babeliales bacterium]MCF7899867.1 SIS domain-containing protein [Candidatus Babeliales bacterium]